jgi:asparagine synthase (glutamine-hydrolysing)
MCGICGIVAPTSPAELQSVLRRMAGTLAHRGPDGEGFWLDEPAGVALGHRRLAIIDLSSAARQPMVSASGRYVITYNGEIYNYRELRAELESAGAHFHTQSDTEVLLAACARWGVVAAAKRFVGIFAFALWDRSARELSLVRDHLGVKPLYWARQNGVLMFGSELRALAVHPAWRGSIDRNALAAYFRHNYVPAPHTIYRDVFKLPPASVLVFRGAAEPQLTQYWNPRSAARAAFDAPLRLAAPEAVERLDAVLRRSVRGQMISDVPLGAFLSGGIDSSTVVALMQAESARPVKTFTIGFREAAYDEAVHARAVASHLGTDHTELYVTPEDARALVPSIADWFDEPFADASQLPTFLVARLARRQVTVALSGDGGDEIFAGYNRYTLADAWWRRMRMLPRPLRRAAAAGLHALSPAGWDRIFAFMPPSVRPPQAGDKLHKFAELFELADLASVYRRLISQWERPEAVVLGGREPHGVLWDASLAQDLPGSIERMQYLDAVTYLPDDILTKVDRASMAVSLEARVPLLDPGVVEFAWRLPRPLRLRGRKGKWLLRQVLHRYVPARLVERPKMGFGVPIDRWLRGPLRDWAEELIDERRLRADGLLDAGIVRQRWREHLAGARNWQYPLWGVLMFQEWKARWIDRAARAAEAKIASG